MAARRTSRRQQGNIAVMFALMLPMILGFMALAVDLGHLWLVKNQLQNAADAASLSGIRDLDGSSTPLDTARVSAQTVARQFYANGTAVSLDLNTDNSASGDIVLGSWDFT